MIKAKPLISCFLVCLFYIASATAQSTLSGYITDEDGLPYQGLELEMFELERVIFTNELGYYVFNDLEEGVYALIIKHPYGDIYKSISVEDSTEYDFVIRREIHFDEVIVQGTRASELDPIAYSEVSGETMALENYGQDIPYLLQYEPSMVVTSDAGTGIGYTGLRIRGSDPTRIAVTINGIPLNDPESQGVWWVDLPDFAASTKDVQIQRGIGSSTNGVGAFGGAMNFNTNKLNLSSYMNLSGSLGAFGTRKASVSVGTGLIEGHYSIDARYSTLQSSGYVDRASADLQSLYLSGVYIGDDQSLRLTIINGQEKTYQAWNGLPYQYIKIDSLRTFNSAGMERPGSPYDNEVDNYNQTHWQLLYNKEFSKNIQLGLTGFYTRGIGFFEQYKAQQSLTQYGLSVLDTIPDVTDLVRREWLNNHYFGLSYSLNYISPNQKSNITLGGLISRYIGAHYGEVIGLALEPDSLYDDNFPQRYYDSNSSKSDVNTFIKWTFRPTEHWQFIGDIQARGVGYTFEGLDENGRLTDRTENLYFINPKAGISYIQNNHLLYTSIASAGHEPNRRDYVDAAPGQVPKSEYMTDVELGYKWASERASIFLNGYYMKYKDQLVLSGRLNEVGEYVRSNVSDSYRRGIEVGGAWSWNNFTLNGNITISQNKALNFKEYIDDWDTGTQIEKNYTITDLSFSPNQIAGWGLDYKWPMKTNLNQSLNFSYRMKYIGAQFMDNTSSASTRLDPYAYSNLQLSYKVSYKRMKEALIKLQINNVFNQKYVSNGWAYRYAYSDPNVVANDPYSTLTDSPGLYNQIGLYPQAGLHLILGLDIKF